MTTILALDSSSDACSVALLHRGELTSLFELAAKSHTQRLLPMVDEILQTRQIGLDAVDAIAFGRGPGSFTGLRICMGVVQGLAFGADIPVIPVSTLHAIAFDFQRENPQNTQVIGVALDARMQEVYWGYYTPNLELIEPEIVARPEDLLLHSALSSRVDNTLALGAGWNYAELAALPILNKTLDVHVCASAIAQIAERQWLAGAAIPIEQAEPVYLRDSVTWQKRERIRQNAI